MKKKTNNHPKSNTLILRGGNALYKIGHRMTSKQKEVIFKRKGAIKDEKALWQWTKNALVDELYKQSKHELFGADWLRYFRQQPEQDVNDMNNIFQWLQDNTECGSKKKSGEQFKIFGLRTRKLATTGMGGNTGHNVKKSPWEEFNREIDTWCYKKTDEVVDENNMICQFYWKLTKYIFTIEHDKKKKIVPGTYQKTLSESNQVQNV